MKNYIKAPAGPASGFGRETSAADLTARIKWEMWAEGLHRSIGHNAHAMGHALAARAFTDRLSKLTSGE
jgi:hypothetical protein